MTPIIHQCDEALSCANMYGHIGDAYIRNLQEISLEDNVELQCKLWSVSYNRYTKTYKAQFGNLLCEFLKKFDLLSIVKTKVFANVDYADIQKIYTLVKWFPVCLMPIIILLIIGFLLSVSLKNKNSRFCAKRIVTAFKKHSNPYFCSGRI